MSHEIKRVPAYFDWELGKPWAGFVNPYRTHCKLCCECGGCGLSQQAREVFDTFYDNQNNGITWKYRYKDGRAVEILGTTKRWLHRLTQDEYDAFLASREPANPKAILSLEEFNQQNQQPARCYHFDSYHHGLLANTRCNRLGIATACTRCDGEGVIWLNKGWKALHDAWVQTPVPLGDWWQVWDATQDLPLTPPFATSDKLVQFLVRVNYYSAGEARALIWNHESDTP